MRRTLGLCIAIAALAVGTPAAFADYPAATGTVEAGGTVSTGSDATPTDPVQVQATAVGQAETITIERDTTDVTRDLGMYGGFNVYVLPQIRITVRGPAGALANPVVNLVFIVDDALIPDGGNMPFGSYQGNEKMLGGFERNFATLAELPNGDLTAATSSNMTAADATFQTWTQVFDLHYPQNHVVAGARATPFVDLFKYGMGAGVGCRWQCTTVATASVTAAVQKKLGLKSKVLGTRAYDPRTKAKCEDSGFFGIPLSSDARKKFASTKLSTVAVTVKHVVTLEDGTTSVHAETSQVKRGKKWRYPPGSFCGKSGDL